MQPINYYKLDTGEIPTVRFIDQVSVKPPHVHVRRQVSEFILYFILSGSMYLCEGDIPYTLSQGDVMLLDPGRLHYGTRPSTCSYYYVHFYHNHLTDSRLTDAQLQTRLIQDRLTSFQYEECDAASPFSPIYLPKHMHMDASAAIRLTSLLEQLQESHHSHLEHFPLLSGCCLTELFIALSRELTDSFLFQEDAPLSRRSTRIIYELLAFLQEHYADKITGEVIEERFGCNFDYINRLFKKTTGITIFCYLNEQRVARARQLLCDGTSQITEVADKCGFRDVYYFSRVFKKYTNLTPGSYKSINKVSPRDTSKIASQFSL